MRYPALEINGKLIYENAVKMKEECDKRNLELVAVDKLVCANKEIDGLLIKAGIKTIGDSRIQNLKNIKELPVRKMLLRIPMKSEIKDVIKYADVTLISELETIKLIAKEAKRQNVVHNLIVMVESGDIREGILDKEELFKTVKFIIDSNNLHLEGLGTNFACYGAISPTLDKMLSIVNLKHELEEKFSIKIEKISAGNSSHITIWNDDLPKEINQIRSGAAILMGIGLNDDPISFLHQNTMKLKVQLVEIKNKPSASWGKRGLNAFGKPIEFEDIGERIKGIVSIGRQDVVYENIYPIDKAIKVLGQSSDHTILDLTESSRKYKVGDVIEFNTDYSSNLDLYTSKYVYKYLLNIKK